MTDRIIALVLGVIVAIGLVVLFLLTHERVDDEIYVPARGEAFYNHLLGAQRMLLEMGYRVESDAEFSPSYDLPPTSDTIFLGFSYRLFEDFDLTELLDWVRDGGHLIVAIEPRYGRSYDPIFTELGIEATVVLDSVDDTDALASIDELFETSTGDNPPSEQNHAQNTELQSSPYWGDISTDNDVQIDFGDNHTIWQIRDPQGVFAGQIGYEFGRLTVLADYGFLHNAHIGRQDNAYVFSRIVGPPADSGKVWIYLGGQPPSLLNILWDKADFLFKIGGLFLLLLLWSAAQTFGPTIAPPARARKSFVEHIAAAGDYLWRKREHELLVSNARAAFLRDFERRHPAGRTLDGPQRDAYLAAVCNMPATDIAQALSDLDGRGHHDFTEKMKRLKTLWKRI